MTQGEMFGDAVATAQIGRHGFRCAWCGTWRTLTQPDPQRRFCGDSCRSKAWERDHPRVPAPRPRKEDGEPSRGEKILARLRVGPATGIELLQAGGGTRYGARLLELRRAGHAIETDMSGEWPTYTLIAERL